MFPRSPGVVRPFGMCQKIYGVVPQISLPQRIASFLAAPVFAVSSLTRSSLTASFLILALSLLGTGIFATLGVSPAQAASDDCTDCISRKQRICSEECDSVEPARAIICQKRCVGGYCSHYCHSKAPELLALGEESCSACRDRQYGLCETHCPTGTLRERAACQLKCSEERCAPRCKGKDPEDQKMVPIPPETQPRKAPKEVNPAEVEPSEDEVETPGLDEDSAN